MQFTTISLSPINSTWVYTESGHKKDPMDGVGTSIKNDINKIWDHLPKDHKQIGMYDEGDLLRCKEMLPQDLKITSKSFGIGSVHEIWFSRDDDKELIWKKLSSDIDYVNAKLT